MDDLTQLIYMDLLELHIIDLEMENRSLYLQLISKQYPIQPSYPWDKTPYNPTPPWVITCQNAVV